ncbi:acetylhydrolase [Actinoplanes sp. NEAU-A12]|uniref:Acetylhydrolase n=1 Tax=Actinoplanes sandaracinus TaxID=3045177 RepID=A0ABT6WWP5_9ACTN|nr:acetylhydrolase [Actinoplanes sandaracinus]MDI6104172.1 acetylhydrolase [Actinoplanes sandaracinus]
MPSTSAIQRRMTRRRLLAAALTTGAVLPIGLAGPARSAPATGPARLTLPPPTGPYPIGTVPLHLVDRGRPNPVAGPSRYRELMVSVWYPACATGRHPLTSWLPDAPMRALLESAGFDPAVVTAPRTAGHLSAPVRPANGRLPVVVYSHGAHDHRSDTTITVQELASHGYAVVTVDHTHDAFTEFPDGRVGVPLDDPALTPWDFAADIRFVLDRIADLAAGRNPDIEQRPLPAGLGTALDTGRIGVFGWSKGGTATALAMIGDERIRAGLSIDGPMQSQPPVSGGLDRPFMMMTAEFTRDAEPSVAEFWSQLRGWRLNIQADGAIHSSYCDQQWLLPQLADVIDMPAERLTEWIGTLAPARAVRIQQAYPLAFFDLHLRRRGHLLDRPSTAFPEVRFLA